MSTIIYKSAHEKLHTYIYIYKGGGENWISNRISC